MFSKMLGAMSVAKAGETIKGLGFDGVDLTVRPQGHVLPENVRRDLPEAVKTLKGIGLSVPMLTTAVTDASEPHAEDVFATAAQCGVKRLKLGYWRYDGFGKLHEQMNVVRKLLVGLERLALKHGVVAGIHTHSGPFMSAHAGVVHLLMKDTDPKAICAYVDPGHLTVEGGYRGWQIGLDLLSGRIGMVAVKDFGWFQEAPGQKKWKHKLVPLCEGMVPWPDVFKHLRQVGFDGPVSVHSEYQGSHSFRDLTVEQLIEQTRQDVAYLRQAMRA
ncbi:MAG: sugar phosphate isomerase/epimerase [Planctomycetes bacterium]|nr:sugar phosphate isomerase/epimerase [Planctomycetota bacterium]